MKESSEEKKNGDHDQLSDDEARTLGGSLRMVLKQADWKDMVLMMLGIIGCVADGLAMALIMIVLSKLMNSYAAGASFNLEVINKPHCMYFSADTTVCIGFNYVAIGVGSGAFLEGFCWARTAERQLARLGRKYLEAVLRQDVGFIDINHGPSMTSQVISSISNDTLTIQGVLTEKIANFITNISMFITAQMAAVYLSWRLAIVGIPTLSMLIIPAIVYGNFLAEIAEKMQQSYAIAGGIVEQTMSSIRTVYSYVEEDHMVKSYKTVLEPTLMLDIKQGLIKGMAMGSIGVTFAVWAFQGWYGSTLVTKKAAKGGDVFTAEVCIIYGGL
ncbi:ABC transporter B family member 15-like [Herrania umbratica]|uniref:ABC transporter B family member 15-like n=1 Tax=Herrania umbratica TaxID=108875 RepID=A0A6J0ZL94_9ROSI|nr:ABC transporter B family member 15-like [Herrania umbratica]